MEHKDNLIDFEKRLTIPKLTKEDELRILGGVLWCLQSLLCHIESVRQNSQPVQDGNGVGSADYYGLFEKITYGVGEKV